MADEADPQAAPNMAQETGASEDRPAATDVAECSIDQPMVPCLRPNGSVIETRADFRTFAENRGVEDIRPVMDALRANLGLPPRDENRQSAAAAEGGEAADVETDAVTAGETRTAEEEFETEVTEDASAEATDQDDEGLSDFQKALLVGLGAVAVGSFLNNGDQVVSNSGDRVVVDTDEGLRVLKNDDVLLRQPGSEVRTETFSDGSTRTFVLREDGSEVVTIRAADGSVLRRSVVLADGTEVELFDDTGAAVEPVEVTTLPTVEQQARTSLSTADEQAIRAALTTRLAADVDRTFSLRQVRQYKQVRALAPEVALDNITFATGSAAIDQSAADELVDLGVALDQILTEDPSQVFLIEGHTDAVGDAGSNLALSDRRAETVALALTQFFDVPPENLITQGYGESDLLIETEAGERLNRRASVRNITDLLR